MERVRRGGNSDDYQLAFLGDVDTGGGNDLSDGCILAWNESSEKFKPVSGDSISSAFLVYAALLNQAGTSVPAVTVLQNNTGQTINWLRSGAGDYYAALAADLGKVAVVTPYGQCLNGGGGYFTCFCYEDSGPGDLEISVQSVNSSSVRADSLLTNVFIEIRIYA